MSITPFPRPRQPRADERPRDDELVAEFSGIEDSILARHVAHGDPHALDQLISRYWRPLTSYASRILDDMALAEDVVQTLFVRVWERRSGWAPRSVKAYLFHATRNLALDALRSRDARRAREQIVGTDDPRTGPTPAEIFEEDEVTAAVDAAIQNLPDRRREAFTLACLKDLTYAEAAAVMGVSPKTVGNHVSAALAELREALGPLVTTHPSPQS